MLTITPTAKASSDFDHSHSQGNSTSIERTGNSTSVHQSSSDSSRSSYSSESNNSKVNISLPNKTRIYRIEERVQHQTGAFKIKIDSSNDHLFGNSFDPEEFVRRRLRN